MLNEWLKYDVRKSGSFKKFQVTDFVEWADKTNVKSHLKKILQDSIIDPKNYEKIVAKLGSEEAKKQFIDSSFPTLPNMEKGLFGEVLAAAIVTEFFDYVIPVQKQQYALTRNKGLPSTDCLAIKKKNTEISEICFIESKLHIPPNTGVAVEAYAQLKNDHERKMPDLLKFVISRLYDTDKSLQDIFLDYLKDRANTMLTKETLRIGITCEESSWRDTALENLSDEVEDGPRQRVFVDDIRIKDLENLIQEIFQEVSQ